MKRWSRDGGEGQLAHGTPDDERTARTRRLVAVALDHEFGALPRVVASGHGAVAERILDLAFAAGVKVRADADLAEILAAVDLGTDIPPEAIVAVAEILAHVYRVNGQRTAVGPS